MVRLLTSREQYRQNVAGDRYRPANGTEGRDFMNQFCFRCLQDTFDEDGNSCPILLATLVNNVDEPDYPEEWVHDEEGIPMCTAFESEEPTDGQTKTT